MTRVSFRIEKARTALIFIEFQAEWIGSNGVLFERLVTDKAPFRHAVRQAAAVLDAARRSGWWIVHAGLDLRSDADYLIFGGGREVLGLRKAIPRAGTWVGEGAEFVEPFVPRRGEFVVRGRSGASVIRNSTLDPFLRNNRIDTILLMGFATHVCVESTLREAHDSGLNALVVPDACAAFTREQDQHVRDHVVHHFGGLVDSDSLIATLSANMQETACSS